MAQESLISSSVSPPYSFHTFNNQQSSTSTKTKTGNNLECRVCEEGFGLAGDKVPRLLLCGHTLCHACLLRLHTQETHILCPFDRQPTPVENCGVWGLKKNFALLELLERLFLAQSDGEMSADVLSKQRELGLCCDEDERHIAVVYCTVCASHLCLECSDSTHATKTLHTHKRIPLLEKPREKPRCADHASHPVEFVCLEEMCSEAPLMCFICKDYKHTKHEHALLDQEAERVRAKVASALQHVKRLARQLTEAAHKLESVSRELEGGGSLAASPSSSSSESSCPPSSADEARTRVREYFTRLRSVLREQEVAAMRALDAHVRERLCSITQQREELASLLAQMVSVVLEGERLLQQDDGRLVAASRHLTARLSQVTTHEHQLAAGGALTPETSFPITFTKDHRIHLGAVIEMRVVTLGLDGAGKTAILFRLKNGEFAPTAPTIGFNVETIQDRNFKFTVWDVGGQPKLRPLWRHYYFNTQAVIFVVDAAAADRLAEARAELTKLMTERELKEAALLIFANKESCPDALSAGALTEALGVHKLCLGRAWHLRPCDAQTGAGLQQGLDWLTRQLVPAEVLHPDMEEEQEVENHRLGDSQQ